MAEKAVIDNISDGLKPKKEFKFAKSLEAKAREIAQHYPEDLENPSPAFNIQREISLTLEGIHRWQNLQDDLHHRLVKSECYVETERMQMEQRMPSYSHYRFAERHKFQRQLSRLGEEKRKLDVDHEERMQTMHQRLLLLLNKHAHIS
ncbi:MAG: hypothetical protein IH984_06155 [Planctomycetes bacterium]|nr:hypothetical protein [Planctomycetota bacterium]